MSRHSRRLRCSESWSSTSIPGCRSHARFRRKRPCCSTCCSESSRTLASSPSIRTSCSPRPTRYGVRWRSATASRSRSSRVRRSAGRQPSTVMRCGRRTRCSAVRSARSRRSERRSRAYRGGSRACAATSRRRVRARRRSGGTSRTSSGRRTARRLERRRRVCLHPRARAAVQPAARPWLRVDRLHPLHGARPGTRRSLGRDRQDRVRAAPRLMQALRHSSRTSTSSRPRRSTSSARWPPSSSGPCCCSPAARTRSCCCASPRRRSGPARFPFPLIHVDTGHNFPEVLEFRDRRVAELGERLVVASVQASIDAGRVARADGPACIAQPAADHDAARRDGTHQFDAAIGGARRDEERSRAKERIFSFRDDFGQWDPRASAPSSGTSTTGGSGRASRCASSRSQLDGARRVAVRRARVARAALDLLRARARRVRARRHAVRRERVVERYTHEEPFSEWVRFRTVGDMSCTGAVRSARRRCTTSSRRSPRRA